MRSVLDSPRLRAALPWLAPLIVTVIAGVLRFANLGHPQSLIFDETYYVKDSYSLWHLGYEAKWPADIDGRFASGDTNLFETNPAYVVHPPLGKWLIGLGMALFGASDAFWWRATTALCGTLAVVLIMLVARTLFKSQSIALIAGLLFAIDGNAIVMSRVALLDNWVMLFGLLGVWFIALDRERHRRLLDAQLFGGDLHHRHARRSSFGPAILVRPWVIAAGAAFGAACAVKWSGLWFVAGFGLYLVLVDLLERRRQGVSGWFAGGILKQAPLTFVNLVPAAVVVYLASWTGWLTTAGGYNRQWAEQPGHAATGFWAWVPHPLQALWDFHQQIFRFHVGLSSPHPAASDPLGWLIMFHPTNMYYSDKATGCGATPCLETIYGVGNPIIWWVAALAVIFVLIWFIRDRDWRLGLVLLALGVSYLPWELGALPHQLGVLGIGPATPARTVFQFYSIVFEPFTLLALAYVLRRIVPSRAEHPERFKPRLMLLTVIVMVFVIVSAFFYPIWSAIPLTTGWRQVHFWLPSWN